MGRGKIEIKRIENPNNRQVTYSKRRNGIIKKAKEIAVLCDAQVSLVVFSSSGKMNEYCSTSTPLIDILDKYHKKSGKKLWDAKHENLSNEIERIRKENDKMQVELRHLKGEDITSLSPKELIFFEDSLENGLANIRDQQMEIWKTTKLTGKILEEDNKSLSYVLHQQEMAMEAGRDIGDGYQNDAVKDDYNCQMPFSFRVQPIQPNLHERI